MISNIVSPGLQECLIGNPYKNDTRKSRKKLLLTYNETPSYNHVDEGLAKSAKRVLAEDIQNHVALRVQLFFQQLLLFYNTGLTFECSRARHQAGIRKTEAGQPEAHSSTLPFLVCKKQESSKQYVLALTTFFYKTWNSTIRLPKYVNQMDSNLDSCTRKCGVDNSLRDVAISILNAVANQKETMLPCQGLEQFLKEATLRIQGLKQTCDNDPSRKQVLECYHKAFRCYQKLLNSSKNRTIKALCFVIESKIAIDSIFYSRIQAQMHAVLIREVRARKNLPHISTWMERSLVLNLDHSEKAYVKKLTNVPKTYKNSKERTAKAAALEITHQLVRLTIIALARPLDKTDEEIRQKIQERCSIAVKSLQQLRSLVPKHKGKEVNMFRVITYLWYQTVESPKAQANIENLLSIT